MKTTPGMVIAIDGPAGAGKSTVAKAVAVALGYVLVDTGAIYRAVAWLARQRGVAWDDATGLAAVVATLELAFRFAGGVNHVFVEGIDVTEAIRTEAISGGASQVSAHAPVRAGLLALQRRLASGPDGAVLEGRDIGTVVCPDADVKIFLTATEEQRAQRRYRELVAHGVAAELDAVLSDLRARDARDAGREVAPLRPADDAVLLDSTQMQVDQVVEFVRRKAEQAAARPTRGAR